MFKTKHLYKNYKNLKKGQQIEVYVSTSMDVMLLDPLQYFKYKKGMKYSFYGGSCYSFPCYLEVPYDGEWYVVLDSVLHNLFGGEFEYSIELVEEE